MILGIPKSAFLLGLAGVIPFIWGVATLFHAGLSEWAIRIIGTRFVGQNIQLFYGTVILSFMSGVIWGLASKRQQKQATLGYTLSIAPALWAFFMTGGNPEDSILNLIAGFLALLLIDWYFWRLDIAPAWWMRFRLLLTSMVVLCLLLGGLA